MRSIYKPQIYIESNFNKNQKNSNDFITLKIFDINERMHNKTEQRLKI